MHAIIFDIDGTLVDSVDAHARIWHDAFLEFGFPIEPAVIRSQIGKGGDQLMPVFLSPSELQQHQDALEKHRAQLWREKGLPRVKPFARVRELFGHLRDGGITLGVASSCKTPELHHYLDLCHVSDLVTVKVSGDDVERSKPHPDIIEVTLGRLGRPPSTQVWMVGDSPFDAQAAVRAGIRAAGVRCGGFPEAELRAAGCEVLFDGPEDLWRTFDGSPLRAGIAPAPP